jgi:glycosyltransferase involved in cell wall biosynthesis
MRIAMLTANDPAGVAIQMAKAVNRLTPHVCRLVTTEIRYNFLFEKDLHVPALDQAGLDELEQVLRESDIFHFHLIYDEHLQLGPFLPKDFLKGKTIVHHHHGHPDFRANPEKYREKYRRLGRKNLLVSTPDLLKKLPEAKWLPNFVPIDEPLFVPAPQGRRDGMLVAHSPTRKELKNTDQLLEIVGRLRNELPGLELDLIENTRYEECLRRKQGADLVFDHMQGYYGVSSIESLSQGKPVIAGLDEWNILQIKEFFGCAEIPWVLARNEAELEDALRRLYQTPALREELGRASRAFMERFWNEQPIIARLIDFYRQAA